MSYRTETTVGTGFTLVMLCNLFFVTCQRLYSCHDNMCKWCSVTMTTCVRGVKVSNVAMTTCVRGVKVSNVVMTTCVRGVKVSNVVMTTCCLHCVMLSW